MAPRKVNSKRAAYITAGPGSRSSEETSVTVYRINKETFPFAENFKDVLAEKAPISIPSEDIVIYKLKVPAAFAVDAVENGIKTLPKNEEELAEIATVVMDSDWDALFKGALPSGYVHLVAWISDMTSATRYELEKKDAPLFNAIKVKISNYGRWSEEDVKNNNVVYATLPSMTTLEEKLRQPRAYRNKSELREAEFVNVLRSHLNATAKDGAATNEVFDDYFVHNPNATQRVVRDPNEFENFSCIKTVCKDFKFDSKDIGRHSGEQAGHFTTFFVQRPARNVRMENRAYVYGEGSSWKFSIYLEFDVSEKGDVLKIETRKYTPMSDFRVDGLHGLPQLIGEVVSDPNHSDLWRMILQAIAIACAGFLLGLKEDFIVFALYVDEKYIARRYLVCKDRDTKKVAISSKDYNLTNAREARSLLLEIYNFIDYITASGANSGVKDRLTALNEEGAKLKSLHSKDKDKKSNSDTQKAESKRSSRAKKGTNLDGIEEES